MVITQQRNSGTMVYFSMLTVFLFIGTQLPTPTVSRGLGLQQPNRCGSFEAVSQISEGSPTSESSSLNNLGGVASVHNSTTIFQSSTHICNAALLSDRHLLTAAHCVFDKEGSLGITVGRYDLNEKQRKVDNEYAIQEIIIHPDYNPATYAFYDLAILMTDRKIKFSNKIWPLCLPGRNRTYHDYQAMELSGWGEIFQGSIASNLQTAYVSYIKQSRCEYLLRGNTKLLSEIGESSYPRDVNDQIICAGREGVHSCRVNSGGPLTEIGSDGLKSIVGVMAKRTGCPDLSDLPGFYTNTATSLDWIYENTGILHPEAQPLTTTDPVLCQFINIIECKAAYVRSNCPNMCNTPDPEFCKLFDTDACKDDSVRAECPNRCDKPGVTCQEDLDICKNGNPCVNGICVKTAESYQCYCKQGFTGKNCEHSFGLCELKNPCVNGVCQNMDESYQCYCTPGFSEHKCDIKNDIKSRTNLTIEVTNTTSGVDKQGICPGNTDLFQENNGNCYHFSSETANWTQARQNCEDLGRNFTWIADLAELDNPNNCGSDVWLMQTITAIEKEFWLGASVPYQSGYWFWANSMQEVSIEYPFWAPDQPSNADTGYCLSTVPLGTQDPQRQYMNGYDCQRVMYYVCQLIKPILPL